MTNKIETINIKTIFDEDGSLDFHVWKAKDGWYSCRSGEYRGNYSESDDIGPFDSREDALQAQYNDYETALESAKHDKLYW